jgi:hypothetical protein
MEDQGDDHDEGQGLQKQPQGAQCGACEALAQVSSQPLAIQFCYMRHAADYRL